jgi:hypothetical protein
MTFNYKESIPAEFHDSSRVWIYEASRRFSAEENTQVSEILKQFVAEWKSHGEWVKGFAQVFFDQFLVIMADEVATGVSGCSTDSSVRVIKQIELQFNLQLFDRQTLAFIFNGEVILIPMADLNQAVNTNHLDVDTLYFDNTVLSKKELLEKWIIPVKNSWLGKRIKIKELTR